MISFHFSRRLINLLCCATLSGAAFFFGLLANAAPASAEVPYQDFKFNSCPNALCQVNFAPPPAGQRLVITNESCNYTTQTNAQIVNAEFDLVDTGNNIILREFVVPSLVSSVPVIGNTYAANNMTLIYVPPTYHLRGRLSVSGGNGESISCKITGIVETP